MRRIVHIDMDAFFAAIEEKKRPWLAGKAVVVGGSGNPAGRGVVAAASYEARKFGIHSAMPLKTAKKLCPGAVFLPADFREYVRISKKIKEILGEITPIIEDVGIDEAYLDISHIDKPVKKIAEEIKNRIMDETGLTCSIGIGPNKLLAKTASDMEKPDGLTVIGVDDMERLFWPLPVRKLRGVGPKTEIRLKGVGIRTVGDLASISLDQLLRLFGKSRGNYLYSASRGIDESEVVTHRDPKSIGKETTFQKDVFKQQVINFTLAKLTKNVVDRMRDKGLKARTVTLKVRFDDFETRTKAKTLEKATDSLEKVRRAAFDCLKKFPSKKKVRLIGIRVENLEPGKEESPVSNNSETLF